LAIAGILERHLALVSVATKRIALTLIINQAASVHDEKIKSVCTLVFSFKLTPTVVLMVALAGNPKTAATALVSGVCGLTPQNSAQETAFP
jgi:hypothetical protein